MERYKLNFSASGNTHIGAGRANNEDNLQIGSYYKKNCKKNNDSFVLENTAACRYVLFLYLMAWVAAKQESMLLFTLQKNFSAHMKLSNTLPSEEVVCIVKNAFQSTNNRIIRSPLGILGTTGVTCILDRKSAAIKFFWAGDSRGICSEIIVFYKSLRTNRWLNHQLNRGFIQNLTLSISMIKNALPDTSGVTHTAITSDL